MPSKEERKKLWQAHWNEQQRTAAKQATRHCYEPLAFPGSGLPVIQVLLRESFKPLVSWHIQTATGGYALYRSLSESNEGNVLVGFDQLNISSERLAAFVTRAFGLDLRIHMPSEYIGGLDGSRCEIALFRPMHTQCRLGWWREQPPAGWEPLAALTEELIACFQGLDAI